MPNHRVQHLYKDFTTDHFFRVQLPRILSECGIADGDEEVRRLLSEGRIELNGVMVSGREKQVAFPNPSFLKVDSETIRLNITWP